MRKISAIIFILSIQFIIWGQSTVQKVLFIGNSYTYVNDLPLMFTNLALSTGDTIIIGSSTPGGHTFNNHTQNSTTLSKIMESNWNYVVLQEQSQLPSFPLSQVETECFPYAHILDSLINHYNPCAETVFYMTWGRKNGDASNCASWPPVCTYDGMDSLLRLRYTQMAIENNAILSPVGVVWKYLRVNNPTIELYSSDESHPSIAGTYAAACAFYASILRKDPSLTTYYGGLDIATAQAIQLASRISVYDSLNNWFIGSYDPSAEYTYNMSNTSISFINNSINSNSYFWDFGDGSNSNLENPTHIYSNEGTFSVKLFSSKCNRTDTISKNITIAPRSISNTNLKKLSISPNPCTNYIQLNIDSEEINYSIYSIFGQKVLEGAIYKTKNEKQIIDLSMLPQGIYLIKIVDLINDFNLNEKIIKVD